ncbi:hypothetical protein ACLOJK_032402 [Asimina triloba]
MTGFSLTSHCNGREKRLGDECDVAFLCNLVASPASSSSPRSNESLRPFGTSDIVSSTYGQPTPTSSQSRPSTCSNSSESRLFRPAYGMLVGFLAGSTVMAITFVAVELKGTILKVSIVQVRLLHPFQLNQRQTHFT